VGPIDQKVVDSRQNVQTPIWTLEGSGLCMQRPLDVLVQLLHYWCHQARGQEYGSVIPMDRSSVSYIRESASALAFWEPGL
jgi:hypothetical protein